MSPGTGKDFDGSDPAFEVHPSVLFRLGEELIQDEVQAIAELVKNSYDANARSARVDVRRDEQGSGGPGLLIVADNGDGMTDEVLRTAFLTLADSPKRRIKDSGLVEKGKRMPLGDKGLGRLGAQRLGRVLTVRTRPVQKEGEASVEHEMSIDWSLVAKAERLSDVRFPIRTRRLPPGSKAGTDLEISGLRAVETYAPTNRLALQRQMVRLVSPFGPKRGFSVSVAIDGDRIDLFAVTKQILDASVLKYGISYEDGRLTVEGLYNSQFFGGGNAPEDQKARESLASDGGKAFIQYLNDRPRPGACFAFHEDSQWFASRHFEADLVDLAPALESSNTGSSIDSDGLGQDAAGDEPRVADPGPFKSEVYMIFVTALGGPGRDSELRDYVREAGGIRIYREGFAINVPKDWLGLEQGATSASSTYGLRSGNVIGYVDLTVQGNPTLIEATDREAFVSSPHLLNFERLFQQFATWADSTQAVLRRQFKVFGGTLLAEDPSRPPSPDEAIRDLEKTSRKRGKARDAVSTAKGKASSPVLGGDPNLADALDEVSTYLDDLESSEAALVALRLELTSLRDQLVLAHETVAVGLSAEALAHEVVSVADRLAREARTIRKKGTWSQTETKHLADVVEAGARTLSKQASYLSPTLRYRREDRGPNKVSAVCEAVAEYHTDRLRDRGISVRLDCAADFSVKMNRGRLTQVLDNLILNSEFWIQDQRRRSGLKQGAEILLKVDRPRILLTDSGPGISPDVESSIFEPFVTTKPRGTGRGLGLFIARQLLEYAGGAIELSDSVNEQGRRHGFVIDLAGAVK